MTPSAPRRSPAASGLDALLASAIRAPSGDNTQPWRFIVDDEAGLVALCLDVLRDRSPMNAGQRMARLALGAALENLLHAAAAAGWRAELAPGTALTAVIRLEGPGTPGPPPDEIAARTTNRRPYDARALAPAVLAELAAETSPIGEVGTHWIGGAARLARLAGLIGCADGVMFGEGAMRRAFVASVRFDAPAEAPVEDGLSLGAIEASAAEGLALRVMGRLPDFVVRRAGPARLLAARARRLVRSASGVCVVAAADDAAARDVQVGRAMQRAWLALTARGLSAQPMMSLPVLASAARHGVLSDAACASAATLTSELAAALPELGGRRVAALLRFGVAPAPGGRTGRRPLHAVVTRARVEAPEVTA
ncbi:MAG: hypothetical protein HY294_10945 [Candidatus Rokubacteria bacterium]|nr:hypothetical protein [Candidatus Rokubacteria bacterium]MBI3826502.1 hypothetical protein [Candidatus Rokubacteria bacterium]